MDSCRHVSFLCVAHTDSIADSGRLDRYKKTLNHLNFMLSLFCSLLVEKGFNV